MSSEAWDRGEPSPMERDDDVYAVCICIEVCEDDCVPCNRSGRDYKEGCIGLDLAKNGEVA